MKSLLFPLALGALIVSSIFLVSHAIAYIDEADPSVLASEAEARALLEAQKNATIHKTGVHIPIFIYHSVHPYSETDTEIQKQFEITPELFEQHLAYLRDNRYTVISLDQAVEYMKTGVPAMVKPVVLTFDDGWHNQYTYALPLLKKYHVPALFYIYTNPIGKERFLSWDDLKEMVAAGMTIGSHTLSHPYMNRLSSEELRREIVDSKKVIQEHLGVPVANFASPFGYWSPEIKALVAEAGYTTGRTAYRSAYQKDPLELHGIFVGRTLDDFVRDLAYP